MGNALGWYTFRDAYQDDPTILEKKVNFEKIKIYESDLAAFYGLLRHSFISVQCDGLR